MAIIEAEALTRSFGDVQAVRGVDLSVERGTVCGLLGPNGAGKTTLVRILTTLLRPDGGRALVGGIDVAQEPERVRFLIGLAGQQAAVDELLTGRANLQMVGRLYHLPVDVARRRADELLERFELSDAAERIAKTYSGGMRRRLDLAASLVAAPPILFLDEPTTGLDPASRIEMWTVLRALVDAGTTLLLTTQYLDEADELADRIVVIDQGLVIAEGTPDALKRRGGASQIDVVAGPGDSLADVVASVGRAIGIAPDVDPATRRVSADLPSGGLAAVVREMDAARLSTDDIAVHRPTLNDVFLRLTGHGIDKEEEVA